MRSFTLAAVLVLAGCTDSAAPGGASGVTSRVSNPATQFDGAEKNIYEPTAVFAGSASTIVAFVTDLSIVNTLPDTCCADRLFRSTDGGRSWRDHGILPAPGPLGSVRGADPVITRDGRGVLHFVELVRPPEEFRYIYDYRSYDNGATWAAPVMAVAPERSDDGLHCSSYDKEWIAPGHGVDELLLVYTKTSFRCALGEEPTGLGVLASVEDIGIYLKRSYDGGTSWAPEQKVWDGYALGAVPKAAPDGTIHIALWALVDSTDQPCPPVYLGNVLEPANGQYFPAIVLASSTDDGANWSFHQRSQCAYGDAETSGVVGKPGDFGGGNQFPVLAIDDSSGAVHVVYPDLDLAANLFSLKLISSADRGQTWSEPAIVPTGEDDARIPALVADGPRLHLAYLTSAEDSGDTWLQSSNDGGTSWGPPRKLSRESAVYSGAVQVRDYLGMDLQDGTVTVLWTQAMGDAPTVIESWTGRP